jgi:hypothetical protein
MNISEEPAAYLFRVEDRCFYNEDQCNRFLRKNVNETVDRKLILEIHLHVTRKYEAHYTGHFIYLNTLYVSECLNKSHHGFHDNHCYWIFCVRCVLLCCSCHGSNCYGVLCYALGKESFHNWDKMCPLWIVDSGWKQLSIEHTTTGWWDCVAWS